MATPISSPNILIIQADQHRQDCIGVYGNPDVKTPHIDGLAADGVRYENSFCPYPVCTPSRYSFLSGLYVRQHLGGSNYCTLPGGLATFPRLLRDAGYRTKAVGKMHFTPTYLDVGFQEMALAEQNGPGRWEDDYHQWLRELNLADRIDLMDQERVFRQSAPPDYWESYGALASNLDEAHHSTTWIGDRAVETLDAWQGGGNLLMASFIKPHHPFDPPLPWAEMYDADTLTLLPGWTDSCLPQDLAYRPGYFSYETLTEVQLRRVMAYYYATISQIDHHIGCMVDLLKRKGLYDDTLILYNSDHGDYLGFHHLLLKGNYMYDPVIKVPLIIKYPEQYRAGEVMMDLVNTVDVAPTLLRWGQCTPPSHFAGTDITDGVSTRDMIFAECAGERSYMVRSHTHKLLLCEDDAKSQFFNLALDPLEMKNHYQNPIYQDMIQALRARLLQWVLFENPSPVHLQQDAAALPTAPSNAAERIATKAYFHQKMEI